MLALVATLMPLVWDDLQRIGKASLILTLALLFAVEYRAIRKDRRDFADQQLVARTEEKQSFRDLLENQNRNFTTTLDQVSRQRKEENDRFEHLLGRTHQVLQEERQTNAAVANRLLPGDDSIPTRESLGCGSDLVVDETDYFLLADRYVNVIHDFPHILLRIKDKDIVTLDKAKNGLLIFKMDLAKRDGTIAVRFDENGFEVNPPYVKRILNKSTLVVENDKGDVVVRAEYLNKRTFRFFALMADSEGRSVRFPRLYNNVQIGHLCFGHNGGVDMVLP